MPYKDKETARAKTAERVRRHRALQDGDVTPDNVTPLGKNVTPEEEKPVTPNKPLFWYREGKKEMLDKVPAGYKVLSDGQVWKPQYSSKPVPVQESGYIGVAKFLIDDEKRGKLRAVCDSLSVRKLGPHVSFGIGGPTMDIVSEMIDMVEAK